MLQARSNHNYTASIKLNCFCQFVGSVTANDWCMTLNTFLARLLDFFGEVITHGFEDIGCKRSIFLCVFDHKLTGNLDLFDCDLLC